MIKLPIVLSEHETWQNAVNGAIADARRRCPKHCRGRPRTYIRPIILFQAQNRSIKK